MKFIARNGSQSSVYDIKSAYHEPSYLYWQGDAACKQFKDLIYDSFIQQSSPKIGVLDNIRFDVHRLSGVISLTKLPSMLSAEDVKYLQLRIVQKLGEHGYIVNLSEYKQHSPDEISYIVYLKPSLKLEKVDGKINQLYGNIHTEVKLVNNQLEFFKIMCHRYNDRNYVEGDSFYELVELLFNTK